MLNDVTIITEEERPLHSPLGASSAERWMNCPGSVRLLKELKLPESDEPEYRKEGTAGHEAAAHCLKDGSDAWEISGQKFYDTEITVELTNAVQVYLDVCRSLITEHGITLIEQHLTARKHALMYGTVDFSHIADSLLNIVDLKLGEGIVVEVENNPQLKYYAYLVLQDHPDVRRVVLRIVQPRIAWHPDGPVRRWETTAEDICAWVEATLIPAMHETELDASLDAGPWCRFCPAKLVCPLMTSLFGAACNANPKNIVNLNDASLGRSYQYVKAVEQYVYAMEQETFRRLNLGHEVPGTKLVYKKANRVYKSGAEAIFKAQFPEEAVTKPELKSPSQMEKIGAKAKELVREWAYTPQTGLTVALDTDSRPGVKPQTTEQAFGEAVKDLEKTNES